MKLINYIIILFILFFTTTVFNQTQIHKYLTTDDGLIDNKIFSSFQDSKGYLWFGTMRGVSRWDGTHFTNITKKDGLPSSAILDITETPDGTMLFSTYNKGFVKYENGVFDTIDTKDGLSFNMVLRFRLAGGKLIVLSDIAQKYENGKFYSLKNKTNNLESPMGDILLENNSKIYAASRTNGFYVNDGIVNKIFTTKDGLLSNKILRLERDINGYILIGTYNGPNKYKNGKISSLKYKGKTLKTLVSDILTAKDGTNYFASDIGLIIEKKGNVQVLTSKNGLLDNNVNQLVSDQNGTIYIGHDDKGISIYHPNRFTTYTSIYNTTKYIANSIIQSNNSNILLGTQNGITIINEKGTMKLLSNFRLSNPDIYALKKFNNGKIYIGTKHGFNILTNNKIIPYKTNAKALHRIYDIVESPEGDAIMAVRRVGLEIFTPNEQKQKSFINGILHNTYLTRNNSNTNSKNKIKQIKVKGGTLSFVSLKEGLQNNWILDLLMSKNGSLLIGYYGSGASIYKNGQFTHINKKNGLSDGIVNTIFEYQDGTYWFGTSRGGISIYKNGIVDTIDVTDGLSSNDIRGIVQVDNKIFVTTSMGLNVLIKKSNDFFIRNITKEDGLVSNSCNRNALFVDDKKNIWIGTNKGISKYNPSVDKIINTPPFVLFTKIEIFNKEYSLNKFLKEKKLKYNQNYLKFTFTGINLSAPEKVLYKYRLSGIDKGWVESNKNDANYTNLDDGKYIFEVKARNEWGFWSNPIKASFIITPVWWETWWFYFIVVISVGSLIAFVVSYRYKHLLAVEKIRTKISADLHDSIGSGLSEITILSELLNSQPNANINDLHKGLKNISVTARSLVSNMSDIVWLVNPSKDSLKDLLLRLQDSYHEVLSQSNISFKINNIENLENIHLSMTYRQYLFLIFKEAINNSLKYCGCTKIELNISLINKQIELIFKDNGKGFDIENQKMGNGLVNMKERAKIINGKLIITSSIDEGTTIKFTGKT